MGASQFVGRVGGLAVALGVGAAVFSAAGAAWADDSSTGDGASGGAAVASGQSDATDRSAGDARGGSADHRSRADAADDPDGPEADAADADDAEDDDAEDDDAEDGGLDAPDADDLDADTTDSEDEDEGSDAPDADADDLDADAADAQADQPIDDETWVSERVTDGTAIDTTVARDDSESQDIPAGSPFEQLAAAYARYRSSAEKSPTVAVPEAAAEPPAATASAAAASATETQPLVLGPSGVPIPSDKYVETVMDYYVLPNITGDVAMPQVVFTPEGLYPITGIKSLPLDTSVDQGLTILSDTLALLPDGTPTTVFGYSQSAIIGSLLQAGYQPPDSPYPPPTIPEGLQDSINFVFVGNEMNPNGGFLSRFPNLNLPSLGIPFYGPTPENAYPTTNYTLEYDGFADFPRYPLNFLADLNAALGLVLVHTKYASPPGPGCASFCVTKQDVENAIELPSTDPLQRYFFIPTENLPLLQPLRMVPLVGNPIADLVQPVLKVIVDLGYGDPAHGFTSATQPDANVLVTFGLFPEVSPIEVLSKLLDGVGQGIADFLADFGPGGSISAEFEAVSGWASSLPLTAAQDVGGSVFGNPSLAVPSFDGLITAVQTVVNDVGEEISGVAASLYAPLLATADILNAIVFVLPAYDIYLFLDGLQQALGGAPIDGLVNAIGLPIAADVGLITVAALMGAGVWASNILGAFDVEASLV